MRNSSLNDLTHHETIPRCYERGIVSGDAIIATADGRNAVSAKQLAEENKEFPAYVVNIATGIVEIKMLQPVTISTNKITTNIILDDDSYVSTNNVLLKNGSMVSVTNAKIRDSLPRFTKVTQLVSNKNKNPYYRINCDVNDPTIKKIYEHRLIAKFFFVEEWNDLYSKCKQSGFAKTGGVVIHHKDYNSLNNATSNLQVMTFKDHSKLHASIDTVGEKNGRYSGISNEEIKSKALNLTASLKRRFSTEEWDDFAKKNKLPRHFTKFRKDSLGDILTLSKQCAMELGFHETINLEPRAAKTFLKEKADGKDVIIKNNTVFLIKNCKHCAKQFETSYKNNNVCCSASCSDQLGLSQDSMKIKVEKASSTSKTKAEKLKIKHAEIYSKLKFKLGRKPLYKEWQAECKKEKISPRLRLKYGFQIYADVVEAGENFNHKIKRIEAIAPAQAYKINLPDGYAIAVVTKITNGKFNKPEYFGVFLP